jgi:hypothetical protein
MTRTKSERIKTEDECLSIRGGINEENNNKSENLHPPYSDIPIDAKKYRTNRRIMNTLLAAGMMSTEIVPNV